MTEVLETGGAGQTGRGSGLCQNQQRGNKRVIMDRSSKSAAATPGQQMYFLFNENICCAMSVSMMLLFKRISAIISEILKASSPTKIDLLSNT